MDDPVRSRPSVNRVHPVKTPAFVRTLLENSIMSNTIKVEILSICAAFAFITGVLVAVW
jgi:Na+-transporting NADH:ubiquinone oxidoreductase subunit NqrD